MFAQIQKLPVPAEAVRAWFLDLPAVGKEVLPNEAGLPVQGWLLTTGTPQTACMIVRLGRRLRTTEHPLPFNQARPDVLQVMLGTNQPDHPQLLCGFNGVVPASTTEFSLGVQLDGQVIWLAEIHFTAHPQNPDDSPALQVLEGRDGWLFLDNDTNHSVDQHTGRLTLDATQLHDWKLYLAQCRSLATEVNARHVILLAASKETVLPELYPHPQGHVSPAQQVCALCEPADHLVDAAAVLIRHPDRAACFIKTDTHWTDRGAMHIVLAVLAELGLDPTLAAARFAADEYCIRRFAGDLGSKLHPERYEPTEFLLGPLPDADARFDNGVENTGRVLILEEAAPVWPHCLMLFAASSAYSMLKYLRRLFARVVFVHSAGHVDVEFVRRERPDFLVLQSTSRFVIVPPTTSFRLDAPPAPDGTPADS